MNTLKRSCPEEWKSLGEEMDRLVTVMVPLREVVSWLWLQPQSVPRCVALPFRNLPEGFRVMGCWVEEETRSLRCLVWHPTFAKVKEGEFAPRWPETVRWDLFELKDIPAVSVKETNPCKNEADPLASVPEFDPCFSTVVTKRGWVGSS